MDRFARITNARLAAPEYPCCRSEDCRNEHLNDEGYCADCAAEMPVEMALDFDAADEPLFVGALTEADLERFAAAEAPAYAVAS